MDSGIGVPIHESTMMCLGEEESGRSTDGQIVSGCGGVLC